MKPMTKIIRYDARSRNLFGTETQAVLDEIQTHYPIIEIEEPHHGPGNKWFVQVYRNGIEKAPEGFFGNTSLEAAVRLAKALKIGT